MRILIFFVVLALGGVTFYSCGKKSDTEAAATEEAADTLDVPSFSMKCTAGQLCIE